MNKMGNVSVIVKKFSSTNKLISDLVTLFTASGFYVRKLFMLISTEYEISTEQALIKNLYAKTDFFQASKLKWCIYPVNKC